MEFDLNIDTLLRIKDGDTERALKYYGMTRAVLDESMESLRQWYKMQPHMPHEEMDDRKLFRHFLTCGLSMEKTKKNIDSYYAARNILPEFTCNRDPTSERIENAFRCNQVVTFPERTDENHRITLVRLHDPDVSMWQASEAFKLAYMIGDYRLMNDLAVGEHYIVQFVHVRMGHLVQFTPSFITKSLYYLQSCVGAKIKGIHLVGLPPYAEAIVNMFKKAVSKKIADRFYTYSDFEELKNIFPAKNLPSDLGGKDISTDEIMENWKQTLRSTTWRQWFLDQENVKTDESRRDKTKSNNLADEILGIHGSFRRLDVD